MLYFNLLSGGGYESMKRITHKGNAFLVPQDYESREPDFTQQLEKKVFAYLRFPPISKDTRSKLLTVNNGQESWQIKLTNADQAVYVAVTPVISADLPSLSFQIFHLG